MDKLGNVLAELAQKLGTTAEHLWPEIVRYRVAAAIGGSSIALLAAIIGALLMFNLGPRAKWNEDDFSFAQVGTAIGTAALAIGSIALLISLPGTIGALVSPEGYTTMWLLRVIGGDR